MPHGFRLKLEAAPLGEFALPQAARGAEHSVRAGTRRRASTSRLAGGRRAALVAAALLRATLFKHDRGHRADGGSWEGGTPCDTQLCTVEPASSFKRQPRN